MSSVRIGMVILLGCISIYLAVVLRCLNQMVKGPTKCALDEGCKWLLSLGIVAVYSSTLSKTWRIYRIFQNAGTQRMVIRDGQLFVIIAVLLTADLFILTVNSAIDAPREEQGSCVNRLGGLWAIMLCIYKLLLLSLNAIMAWKVRQVNIPSMDDAKYLNCCIFLSLISTIITLLIYGTFPQSGLFWVSTTVILLINATSIQVILFGPKVTLYRKYQGSDTFKVSLTQLLNASHHSHHRLEEEFFNLVTENRHLKNSLQEKEVVIRSLQEHVTSAKEKLLQLMEESRQDSGLDLSISTCAEEDSRWRSTDGLNDGRVESIARDLECAQHLSADVRRAISQALRTPGDSFMYAYYARPGALHECDVGDTYELVRRHFTGEHVVHNPEYATYDQLDAILKQIYQ